MMHFSEQNGLLLDWSTNNALSPCAMVFLHSLHNINFLDTLDLLSSDLQKFIMISGSEKINLNYAICGKLLLLQRNPFPV
ncbi:MAG: hypothetical protein CME64_12475 [Halobacteriovoraceae bacterium]|nr:hypothetical protein [Halobacteriovoraceae bacterium]